MVVIVVAGVEISSVSFPIFFSSILVTFEDLSPSIKIKKEKKKRKIEKKKKEKRKKKKEKRKKKEKERKGEKERKERGNTTRNEFCCLVS